MYDGYSDMADDSVSVKLSTIYWGMFTHFEYAILNSKCDTKYVMIDWNISK